MPKQTIYLVFNVYDYDTPDFVRAYDNRDAAEQHAAYLNKYFEYLEDELVFEVREGGVLSEFNP